MYGLADLQILLGAVTINSFSTYLSTTLNLNSSSVPTAIGVRIAIVSVLLSFIFIVMSQNTFVQDMMENREYVQETTFILSLHYIQYEENKSFKMSYVRITQCSRFVGSSRKSQMFIIRIPYSSQWRGTKSFVTIIFRKESSIFLNGLISCSRFPSSGIEYAD